MSVGRRSFEAEAFGVDFASCKAFRIDPSPFRNSLRPKQEFAFSLRESASSQIKFPVEQRKIGVQFAQDRRIGFGFQFESGQNCLDGHLIQFSAHRSFISTAALFSSVLIACL
jgi:hypothetical protein